VGFNASPQQQVESLEERLPIAQWQMVTVTFLTPLIDVEVPHSLKPSDPEDIYYLVVRRGSNGVIFQDMAGTRKPWQRNYILLQSTVAMSVDLLLFVLVGA
jgi:hypothetical protein